VQTGRSTARYTILHLRREGFADNHKRIERIYAEARLQVRKRRKSRRRYPANPRFVRTLERADDRWAADFVHDGFLDGRPFRCLTIIDELTWNAPEIEVERSIGGHGVVEVLERRKELLVDNGPEFRSRPCYS